MCIIEFCGVEKQYHYDRFPLLNGIDFKVAEGETAGIVAEKQCGKTTIVKMIAQLTLPTHGKIFYNGLPLEQTPPEKRKIGVLFEDLALMQRKTVYKNVCYPLKVRKIKDFSAADNALEQFGLKDVASVKVKNLPPQDKLKTALARLSLRKLDLLVLDDADRNICGEEAIEYIDRLKQNCRAVLMLSSDICRLANCGKIFVIADGKTVFCGAYDRAKQYIEQSKCFDKFGIDEDMKKISDV